MNVTVPIPVETRALASTVVAELSIVRRALSANWTTPASAEIAERALTRIQEQTAALRLQVRQLRAAGRQTRVADALRRVG
ncbi:hypothetical protein [Phenylobacterium sp.]|uniref:hypothetical protein n=1 Tax=Phenylobacterium sp. TaxID=1871053 RepID=UPI0025FFEEEC|nr:hypothetical protein [Phenylobacterium sp.]MCA6339043.1 hypothetical protein [Phenylobacterium sp.]MCA6351793.1 hypothetical protein [Phenylobacterium sp.]MCA6361346.1 hypothetical protein [Phenylobacterium sp.]